MTKLSLSLILFCLFIANNIYSQTTIPNSDFENWQNVGSTTEEPSNWNGNKTGGGFASSSPQTVFREATNPNSGAYCLKLDNASFFGNPVTAVATTGKIEAPTSNPAQNYVNTVRSDANFNAPFIGRPDSLIGWYRFTLGGTDAPKIHAVLHGDYDVQDPADASSIPYLIGDATFIAPSATTSAWTRFAVPFTYSSGSNPMYLLLTAMASSGFSGANANSILWVDNLSLKYCIPTTGTDVKTSCNAITWIDGNTYSTSNNTATHILANAAGCDSTVTLNFTKLNASSGTDVQTSCNAITWIDGNTYSTSNNTATHTLTNAAGCDSIVTLNFTKLNASSGTDVQTSCNAITWIDGNIYSTSNNTATHILTNAAGCDSIVTLNFTKLNASTGTDVQTSCNAITWIDGNTYSTSNNTATHILTNAAGCDSIVTLNFTKLNASSGTDVQTSCNAITWIDGNNYSTSNNTATHTLTNAAGCDSIVTLNFTKLNASSGTDVQTSCNAITWIDGNTYSTSNNTATHILTNAAGCDSTVTLNLTVHTLDLGVTNSSPTLSANQAGATYQWLDCDNANAVIPGETLQSFTATTNGNYAVEITFNSCTDTSACQNVSGIGMSKTISNNIKIYPVPTKDNLTVSGISFSGNFTVEIVNQLGQVILTKKFKDEKEITISTQGFNQGTYQLLLKGTSGLITKTIVIIK